MLSLLTPVAVKQANAAPSKRSIIYSAKARQPWDCISKLTALFTQDLKMNEKEVGGGGGGCSASY